MTLLFLLMWPHIIHFVIKFIPAITVADLDFRISASPSVHQASCRVIRGRVRSRSKSCGTESRLIGLIPMNIKQMTN